MKKARITLITVGCIVLGLLTLVSGCNFAGNPVSVTDEPVTFSSNAYNAANYQQWEANVKMAVCNGKLYVLREPPNLFGFDRYTNYLSCFEDGELKRIKCINDYIYMSSEFIYCGQKGDISCISLSDGSESKLPADTTDSFHRTNFCAEDGTVYFAEKADCSAFSALKGDKVDTDSQWLGEFSLSSGTYRVIYFTTNGSDIVLCGDSSAQETLDLAPGEKTLSPCSGGLLVHNEHNGDSLLYYINGETGEVTSLFSVECMYSVSAFNVHEDNVYLSFMRYEKYGTGNLGMVRYENDTLEGTYRINLNDFSAEKISNSIYNGLYIFDDTGIYACDEQSNIYKLDFDGNVILTLLEKE